VNQAHTRVFEEEWIGKSLQEIALSNCGSLNGGEYGVRDATNNNMLVRMRMRMVRWQSGSMAGGGDGVEGLP
jgi:hypothetical protein